MTNGLNKLLNVRPGEWTRLLLLSGVITLVNIGVNWGMTAAYAAFLKQTGLQSGLETLIWVLLLSSVLSIPVLSIYATVVDRANSNHLFAFIVMTEATVIVISLGLLLSGQNVLAFPLLYVLAMAVSSVFNAQFFTYINDVYDIQTAKRALPLILASGRIGAALAGFTLKPITSWLGTQGAVWLWLVSDFLVIGLILSIPVILKEDPKKDGTAGKHKASETGEKSRTNYLQSLSEGLNFTMQSSFLRWLAAGTLVLTAVMTLLEYDVNQVLSPLFATTAEFAGFLGQINAVANLVALIILLFGISRVTKAWGIAKTSLIFPVGNLLLCGWMFLFPGIASASFGNLNRRGLRFSLQMSIEAQLYNAVPLRIKGRARAFVSGLVAPIGAIAAVLLLLTGKWNNWPMQVLVPAMLVVFSVLYLAISLVIRSEYSNALVKMLEEEDYTFLLNEEASELVVVDPAAMQRLKKMLEESASHEMRIFVTQLIAQTGGAESISLILPVIKTTSDPRTRAAMLNVVAAAGQGGEKSRELYTALLSDSDGKVRQAAAAGLEQLLGAKDTWLQEVWLGMVSDADAQVSLYAMHSLATCGSFYQHDAVVEKANQFLKNGSMDQKKSLLNTLGKLPQVPSYRHLLAFLQDENDLLRLEAVLQLENMEVPQDDTLRGKLLEQSRQLLSDPVASIRQAALKILGRANNRADYPLLIAGLTDKDASVRAAVVDILAESGKDILPEVQLARAAPDPQLRKMATVVLSCVQPRQFGPLIEDEVFDTLSQVYQTVNLEQALSAYDKYASVRLLLDGLREANEEQINDCLYLLSAVHPRAAISVIRESLHSDAPATRSLALEALESLTSRRSAALIAALFEPATTSAQLVALARESWPLADLGITQVFEKLLSHAQSRTLLMLAVHALRDIVSGQPKPKTPARRGARLLQMLEEPAEQAPSAPQPATTPDALPKLKALLHELTISPDEAASQIAVDALQKLAEPEAAQPEAPKPLSIVERMITMREVAFFRNIPISQLEMLAAVCQEKSFAKGDCVYQKGDPGGVLYIVVDGEISIEQGKRAGTARTITLKKTACFGEMTFFDSSSQVNAAVVSADSRILELQRAPVISLTTQNPELSLELINVLSQRIRETSDQLASLARSRPRELHKLFDQLNN